MKRNFMVALLALSLLIPAGSAFADEDERRFERDDFRFERFVDDDRFERFNRFDRFNKFDRDFHFNFFGADDDDFFFEEDFED